MPTTNSKRLLSVAFHEAGHALVAHDQGIKVKRVSIIPDTEKNFDGIVIRAAMTYRKRLDYDNGDKVRLECERFARMTLAGGIAQKRHNPKGYRSVHASSDNETVANVMSHMVGSDNELEAWIKLLGIQSAQIVEIHWDEITRLAEILVEVGSMEGKEFYEFLKS